MLIALPLAFLGLLYLLLRLGFPARGRRESLLAAMLVFGFLLGLGMQALSLLSAVNRPAMAILWGILDAVVLTLIILMVRHGGRLKLRDTAAIARKAWAGLDGLSRVMLSIILLYALVLLAVALLAPPNTNDSLRYHMPRVMHWLNNGSLAHYATPISRQLYMQTWSELAVMNLLALWGGDRLVNLVQWASMVGALVGVSLIARRMGAGARGQIFAAFFAATLPMGILQATSTQTDYVTGLWAVCLAYYVLVATQEGIHFRADPLTPLGISVATGLGVMTKGSFFAVAAPFLLWLLLDLVRHRAWRSMAGLALLGTGVMMLLNAPDFSRNYRTFGSPLGPASGHVGNARITAGVTLSNLVRNATLHTATPWGEVNGIEMVVVKGLLKLIGQDANDPASTLGKYHIDLSYHEDFAGNPVHFALMLVGTLWLFWAILRHNGGERGLLPWLFSLLLAWVLFSALFKWQPYGSRLQLPLFVLWAPPAGLLFERLKSNALRAGLAGLMVLASFIFVISTCSIMIREDRIATSLLRSLCVTEAARGSG